MSIFRVPLGSVPGIAAVVVCAFLADAATHHHVPLHMFSRLVSIIDDRR